MNNIHSKAHIPNLSNHSMTALLDRRDFFIKKRNEDIDNLAQEIFKNKGLECIEKIYYQQKMIKRVHEEFLLRKKDDDIYLLRNKLWTSIFTGVSVTLVASTIGFYFVDHTEEKAKFQSYTYLHLAWDVIGSVGLMISGYKLITFPESKRVLQNLLPLYSLKNLSSDFKNFIEDLRLFTSDTNRLNVKRKINHLKNSLDKFKTPVHNDLFLPSYDTLNKVVNALETYFNQNSDWTPGRFPSTQL